MKVRENKSVRCIEMVQLSAFIRFVSCLLSMTSLSAAVILSDDFAYPDGPITNAPNAPWIRHSGGGAGEEALIVSGKLQLSSGRTEDVNALLAGQPYTVSAGAILYTSFTVNFSALPTQAGSYFAHFKDNSTGHRARVWASTTNAPGGFFRLGIGNGTSANASSGQLSND